MVGVDLLSGIGSPLAAATVNNKVAAPHINVAFIARHSYPETRKRPSTPCQATRAALVLLVDLMIVQPMVKKIALVFGIVLLALVAIVAIRGWGGAPRRGRADQE